MTNHPNRSRAQAQAPATAFGHFRNAVAKQFLAISGQELFRTTVDKDALWACYLDSWPDGTNRIFRQRREHDCSCCRHFVRSAGNIVGIRDGALVSIWDVDTDDVSYRTVSAAMSALVRSQPIENIFIHTEHAIGSAATFEDTAEGVRTWEHFAVTLPNVNRPRRGFVCKPQDIGPILSQSRADHDVLLRSLSEITPDAVGTVLDLIAQNSLYRGEEHKASLTAFRSVQQEFCAIPTTQRDLFAWERASSLSGSVARIRNTSIGTLLVELSEGMDLEKAVGRFEAMVAPHNYKRPTALVTPAMVKRAKETIEGLGLTSALDRRYAELRDVSVNNVLFADRNARKAMSGDVFDAIAKAAPVKTQSFDKVEEIPIERFVSDILPGASSVEMLVENRLAGNFVSLIAPADPTAAAMFKWDNRFSWSYAGDVADSIRERVKKAGGNVTGDLCCRLAWSNYDDLDFHMTEPPTGAGRRYDIFYGNRGCRSPCGGQLDVDANGGAPQTRQPVENIFYEHERHMQEGAYHLYVHQFSKRETNDTGFEAEIDYRGTTHRFAYPKMMRQRETVTVAEFTYSRASGITLVRSLPSTSVSRKVWGIGTEAFHRVSVIMLSPNHWDGHGVGNRHYFWFIDGCQNDGSARGFYNEFLRTDLDEHRKVLEMVGSRMRAEASPNQLSGLGFSSTQRNNAVLRIKGSSNRVVRITF